MKKDKLDGELTDLLTKLYTIQEDIGAKPKSSDEEKRSKAENVASLGKKGTKAEKKGSRFLQLKSGIVDRLKTIHQLLKDTKEKEAAGYGGDNAKEIIKLQAEIREQLRQVQDEWKELDALYKKEAAKKNSKFTTEELDVQAELVKRLNAEIEKVKEAQMKGYARNRAPDAAVGLNTQALHLHSLGAPQPARPGSSFHGPGGGVALTDGQQQQILQLEERDADFDRQLDEIGEGINDLAEIAALQGEEVKRQNAMLQNLNDKMDKTTERMTNVNSRMKETLEEVGRASDKLCVDIMCIVLAVGFVAVIVNFARQGKTN